MLQPTETMSDLDPGAPVVDGTRIKQVHEELQGMYEITLDADPLSAGPKMMQNKKAAVRNQLSRCTQLELQLLEDRGWFQRELTREQAKYEISYTELIANNPHVRAGRSTVDREAAAKVILAASVRSIKNLELAVEDLERLLLVVKAKKADLKNLQSQLRDQLKICDHELGLGNKWGFKSATASNPYSQTVPTPDVIDELIESVDSDPEPVVEVVEEEVGTEEISVIEAHDSPAAEDILLSEEEVAEVDDVLVSTATSTETDAALAEIDVEVPKDATPDPGEVDVDDILNGLDFDE